MARKASPSSDRRLARPSRDRIAGAAPVVLEIVNTPGGLGLGVLRLVAVAACIAGTGLGARAGVDAELQSLGVDVVGERLHVGELVVGVDVSVQSRSPSQVSSMLR